MFGGRVFDPATVAAGNYAVSVDSNGDGYYELTDHSYLIKAIGIDYAFDTSATLAVTSAIDGLAFGTIKLAGSSFSRQLQNMYVSRTSGGGGGGGGAPNLTISAFSASPTHVIAGETVSLAATIRNAGTGNSSATTLRYYEWLGSTWSEMTFCRDSVGSLVPGQTSSQSCAIVPPSVPGTYQYGVGVDPVSGESVTTDNASGYVSVTVSGGAGNNYQGLWWNAPAGSESGWGINFAHQGDDIFATWFTYDATGKALWLSMTATKSAEGVYTGMLYQTRGPPFSAVPFSPAAVIATTVGSGTLTFTDANNGSFAYTVYGVSQTKAITRQAFGPLPTCTFGAQPNLALATNYQDLWWAVPAGTESGWGVNFTHQGDTIFATWFTYDVDGTPLWLSATAPKTGPGVYTGTLYRTTGPAFNAMPFLSTSVTPAPVGTLTLTFASGNDATFAYTVGGVTQSKRIARQVFHAPGTVCM